MAGPLGWAVATPSSSAKHARPSAPPLALSYRQTSSSLVARPADAASGLGSEAQQPWLAKGPRACVSRCGGRDQLASMQGGGGIGWACRPAGQLRAAAAASTFSVDSSGRRIRLAEPVPVDHRAASCRRCRQRCRLRFLHRTCLCCLILSGPGDPGCDQAHTAVTRGHFAAGHHQHWYVATGALGRQSSTNATSYGKPQPPPSSISSSKGVHGS